MRPGIDESIGKFGEPVGKVPFAKVRSILNHYHRAVPGFLMHQPSPMENTSDVRAESGQVTLPMRALAPALS